MASGAGVVHGAVRMSTNIVGWFASNIVGGIIVVIVGFGVVVHVLPFLFFMAFHAATDNDLQAGVDSANNLIGFVYNVLGAGWGSKDVGAENFSTGVDMSRQSLAGNGN